MSKFLMGVGVVVAGAIVIRTLGRLSNPVYTNFMSVLATAQRNFTPANKQKMAEFDFQFSSWPWGGWPLGALGGGQTLGEITARVTLGNAAPKMIGNNSSHMAGAREQRTGWSW